MDISDSDLLDVTFSILDVILLMLTSLATLAAKTATSPAEFWLPVMDKESGRSIISVLAYHIWYHI